MNFDWIEPQVFVWIAGGFYVLGYLVINQQILRLLLLTGTGFYLAYYYTATAEPLWEAIYMSALMGIANLIGLASLSLRNSPLAIPRQHRDIYDRFSALPPGDFRELVSQARRVTFDSEQLLTREGAPVDALYYIISGALEIEKRGERFAMPAGVFVGEVAYLTDRPSSATTRLSEGAEVLMWDPANLRKRAARKTRFKLTLEAMISNDLALKVAVAVAPHGPDWDHMSAVQELKSGAATGR